MHSLSPTTAATRTIATPALGLLTTADHVLLAINILAVAVWVGGLVTIFVVARVAAHTLDPATRVAFFRRLGRSYGPIGAVALATAIATGAVLVDHHRWNGLLRIAAEIAIALVVSTATGVLQARAMTRQRQRALAAPADEALALGVRRGALRANALRSLIGLFTLALLAVAVAMVK